MPARSACKRSGTSKACSRALSGLNRGRRLRRELVLKEALIEKARVQDELRTMKARSKALCGQLLGQVLPPPESEEKEKEAK